MKNGTFSIPRVVAFLILVVLAYNGVQGRSLATKQAKLAAAAHAKRKQSPLSTKQHADLLSRVAQHSSRAKQLLGESNVEAAISEYSSAIKIQTAMGQQSGDLAMSYINRGIAHRALPNPDAAIGDFSVGIKLFRKLVDQGDGNSIGRLTASYRLRASVYRDEKKATPAIDDFGRAIELQKLRVNGSGDNTDLALELATIHTDRGYLLHSQGKQAAASEDFDNAIEIRTRLVEAGRTELSTELARSHNNRGISRRALGNLAAAVEDFGRAIELRSNFTTQDASTADDLAGTYNNRGNALSALGDTDGAIQDYEKAIQIRSLHLNSGAPNQALQLVRSLCTLAWIYATHADDATRDSAKAMTYSNRACELSDWKYYAALQTLAAANANAENFEDAIKWQEKALAIAPAAEQDKLREALALYQSNKPYRQ